MPGSRLEKALSQRTTSAVSGFLRLPIETRNDIYNRVLAVPHPIYLFQDTASLVESFAPEKPHRWPALLYVNRQISDEARVVLYNINHFTLMEVETKQKETNLLKSFLNRIGPVNTGLLSHLTINFPATERTEEGGQSGMKIRLREDGLQDLQLLQRDCIKLKTLETVIYTKHSKDLIKDDQSNNNTQRSREALVEINEQFKRIVSLNRIIVRVQSGSPAPSIKAFMQELGWVVLLGDK